MRDWFRLCLGCSTTALVAAIALGVAGAPVPSAVPTRAPATPGPHRSQVGASVQAGVPAEASQAKAGASRSAAPPAQATAPGADGAPVAVGAPTPNTIAPVTIGRSAPNTIAPVTIGRSAPDTVAPVIIEPSSPTVLSPASAAKLAAETRPAEGYEGPDHESARELVRQGREYAARGEQASAIRRFTEALLLDPAFGPAYVELGAARERMGDLVEAGRVYDRGVAYAPRFSGTYLARAALRERLGDREQARIDFEAASQLGATDFSSLREIGARHIAARAWPAALATFRRLVTLAGVDAHESPQLHEARVQVAALSILCGELDPVRAGASGRGWTRAALASTAQRKGASAERH